MTRAASDLLGELIPLEQLQDWDRHIAAYPQKRIFHEAAWLKFLALDHRGEAKVLRIATRAGQERALWPGLVVRKGPVRIFGSPLRGWGTPVMGPLFHEADASALLPATEAAFARARIHHWEFVSDSLLPPPAGEIPGYRYETSDTHRIALYADEGKMWASVQQRCRTAVRKAAKNGLTCHVAQDGKFLEPLFSFVQAIFARKKTTVSYDLGRLRRLWDMMHPLGKAIGLEVRLGEQLAAAGLFIFDDRQAFAWSEASNAAFNPLGPNNLLYWEAMRYFGARGHTYLHLPGAAGSPIGKFKASFNPEVLSYPFWIRDHHRLLRWGRRAYQEIYSLQAKWRYLRSRREGGKS